MFFPSDSGLLSYVTHFLNLHSYPSLYYHTLKRYIFLQILPLAELPAYPGIFVFSKTTEPIKNNCTRNGCRVRIRDDLASSLTDFFFFWVKRNIVFFFYFIYLFLLKCLCIYIHTHTLFFSFSTLFIYLFLEANYFTILYWFCHTLTWIHHGCTCVHHPEPLSHLPPHPIPLGHPSAPVLSTLSHVSNLDWWSISHMVIYMFQCHSSKPSHRPLPRNPKDCSIHLCLFCCLAYRVIITIFLNSIYMH